ncbi:MAG: FkbM family methyltransferase [Acetobacteraceae bacterium]|nr:FkbM family methyltransferase [Acetobacteraceae bacterium]
MEATIEATRIVQVTQYGRSFHRASHPLIAAAGAEFCSGFEDGTLRFFNVALPHCDRMVDFGAYVGFTTLYAATFGGSVFAFEPSPRNFALLTENVAANPLLAGRIRLFRHGLGVREEEVTLYAKGMADSGSSIFRDIERDGLVRGAADATIVLRDAEAVLREVRLDHRTLLKIDIEGAEYLVLPAIAALLADRKPWLHVSFHPFNLVQGANSYANAVARLRASFQVAEALASYRYMHLYSEGMWTTVGPAGRMDFLRQYLLKPKPVPRVASPQYGFVDAVGFSEEALPEGA